MKNHRLLRTAIALFPVVAIVTTLPVEGSPAGAAPATQAPLTAAQARALSTDVNDKVIVVFKNQLTTTPETIGNEATRNAAVAGIQSPVVHELSLVKAQNVKSFQVINAVSATVSPGEAQRLAANPDVAEVVKDEPIPVVGPSSGATVGQADVAGGAATGASGGDTLKKACLPSPQVQLDPEAIENIHAASQSGRGDTAQALGYTGAGVKVAFIADGLNINDPDFIRADGQKVFVDYQDFSGTGTDAPTDGAEAFLDASSIAAQGLQTYNVASYGAGLPAACLIRILGVAPGASLVGLNVFGSSDEAFNSVFLEAINYAVTVDHVNVINESFGSNPFPDTASLDLTRMADEAAVAAGVTVTVSSGDAGSTNTIGSPATDPEVISAGATTTYRAYAQTGIGGINLKGVKGWLDNNVSGLSSGGFAEDGSTVDVVAPGDLNWALCSPPLKKYFACSTFTGKPAEVELQGGTSEASPLTAGTAALVIQAYAEAHGGTDPTPAIVKEIITSTATDIDAPGDQQGAGMIDAYAAVLAARSYAGSTGPAAGDALLKSANQLNAVGQPGTSETLGETVTNDGKGTTTVGVSSRTLGPYVSLGNTTVTLAPSNGDSSLVQFTVPAGQARLDASVTSTIGVLNLSLFTPDLKLAEYNLPQGAGNYGDAQVADPAPGTWTALVYGSASGTVLFGARAAPWASFGTLSASSLTLAPGASATVSLSVPTPSSPGDQAGAIVFTDAGAGPAFTDVTTVPVTLRSLVPTPDPSTSFNGTLTGGNGRQSDTGQTAYYQFDVGSGLGVLNADISSADADNTFMAQLVDPGTGQSASTATNSQIDTGSSGPAAILQDGAQLHVLDPDAGLWTLIVDFYNTVSGTALSEPFSVTLDTTPASASTSGLPDSAATKLAAGTPVKAKVTVTNTGNAPESYFIDGRLGQSTAINLSSTTDATVPVPITGAPPTFVVPSHTTSITADASASAGIFFDFSQVFGDPDLMSDSQPFGENPTGTLTSSAVADGAWTITPFQDGPDGNHGVPPVSTTTSLTATTAAFDPAVAAPTGDLWLESVDPGTVIDPVVVDPGKTVTIPVTITPDAAPGTTVSGTLYLDDGFLIGGGVTENGLTGTFPQGSDVAAFNYEYTVG
jgi:Peptidase inhibitor I9